MYKPTGSNMTPLGVKRRFTSDGSDNQSESSANQDSHHSPVQSSPVVPSPNSAISNSSDGSNSKRKRKSRWGHEQQKVILPGLPTAIARTSRDQSEKYLLQLRIEEISRKLHTGEVVPRERSPSPEPVYGPDGKRVNTREARYRKKLEDERHKLVDLALKTIPNFKPPFDYKRPSKIQEKVYIPSKEFPDINFIGQLIGPRGNTLKNMESESGAKISIRGKGSVKEGKSRTDAAATAGQEEDLHCLVTADTEDKVKKAIKLIEKIIETSASVPEGQNELKRSQLRELAALNGTLREDDTPTCLNCGSSGHRRFECPERQNVTNALVCQICGGGGHIARDCNQRNNPVLVQQALQKEAQLDSEYMNLMAELGETVSSTENKSYTATPWQQSKPGAAPPPWQQSKPGAPPPPWAAGNYGQPPSITDAPSAESAPWQAGGYNAYSAPPNNAYYNAYGSYGGYYDQSAPPPPGNAAPWQQQAPPPPPPSDGSLPPPPPPSSDAAPPPPPPST